MVAALLSEPGRIQKIRNAVCDTIHISRSSTLGHAVGETIKNGLWGDIAFVATIPYIFGQVLLVVNRLGKSKLDYEMNASELDHFPTEGVHGFGSVWIKGTVGHQNYHMVRLGLFCLTAVVMTNAVLREKGAHPGTATS